MFKKIVLYFICATVLISNSVRAQGSASLSDLTDCSQALEDHALADTRWKKGKTSSGYDGFVKELRKRIFSVAKIFQRNAEEMISQNHAAMDEVEMKRSKAEYALDICSKIKDLTSAVMTEKQALAKIEIF